MFTKRCVTTASGPVTGGVSHGSNTRVAIGCRYDDTLVPLPRGRNHEMRKVAPRAVVSCFERVPLPTGAFNNAIASNDVWKTQRMAKH